MRDYRIHTAHNEIVTGGPAFDIKAKSLRLGNFNRAETEALWQPAHRNDQPDLRRRNLGRTLAGHRADPPWLVDALGYGLTWEN